MSNNTQIDPDAATAVQRRRVGEFKWLIGKQFLNTAFLARLERPEQLLLPPAVPLKKAAPGREVVRFQLDDPAITEAVVKRFTPRGLLQNLKCVWRLSPAYRAFHLARQITALGFLTAAPMAAGERRVCGLLRESFLLAQFISGATPLHLVNARCADRQRRIRVVRALAKLYATLHDAGFFHHDPSQSNFLVVPQPGGNDAIALIDLDGLRRQRWKISLTAAVRDLRRFLLRARVPRRERAWFITIYARSRKARIDAQKLVQMIGPLPPQATYPHCALNEDSSPEENSSSPPLTSSNSTTT